MCPHFERENGIMAIRAMRPAIVLLCLCLCESPSRGESPNLPDWIWTSAKRISDQPVYLRKAFSIPRRVVKAELCITTDFNSSAVFLDGEPLGEVPNFSLPLRQELTGKLRTGDHVLAVRSFPSDGPSAIAVQIEIEYEDGSRDVVRSDETWHYSLEADTGWMTSAYRLTTGWKPAQSYGRVEEGMLPNPLVDTAVQPWEDYTQWTQALGTETGTDPASFSIPEGFEIKRLRSAGATEGSWVSLEFDPKGRLVIGREDQGLLRLTLPPGEGEIQIETINDTLLECRGLLFAHDSLYASANNSKGLYRLKDTDGDDQFDEVKLIYASEGGVGHGRNDLALGADGKVYLITGDAVELPRNVKDLASPFRESAQGERTSEGHVLRFNPDGSGCEIVAAGLRNPYGISMHPSGEFFTYDADAEYDMGSPWYRPTRIIHLTPGSDYGWRGVTKSWPPYYPDHADNAPPVLDIGKGSPTGVKFGTNSKFPKHYRDSLFVSDWAYGRILSVSLTPRGSSFAGRAKPFLKGQPFNVTDLDFGPDGAMYVVTGGRKTQSALYRIRYAGPTDNPTASTPQQIAREEHAKEARKLRHQLESLLSRNAQDAVDIAWPHLKSEDPWIRYAARIVLEHQPVATWHDRALQESEPTAALTAWMALARDPKGLYKKDIVPRLVQMDFSKLTEPQKLMALECYLLCLNPNDIPARIQAQAIEGQLGALFPQSSNKTNMAISQVLARLQSESLVPKIMDWLPQVTDQSLRMHGLYLLRDARLGWTAELRQNYFRAVRGMREFQGGEGLPTFIHRIEDDALAALDPALSPKFEEQLKRSDSQDLEPAPARPFIQAWKLDDLEKSLESTTSRYDFERGKKVFREALCIRCHRMGFEGAAVGPDLTSLGRRFSRRDILESILNPSKVVAEQYRLAKIQTKDGRSLSGQILPSRDYRSPQLLLATKPLEPYEVTEIPKVEIEEFEISETSVMPNDLLNHFTKEEILDLLGWLEAGGNPNHPNYR